MIFASDFAIGSTGVQNVIGARAPSSPAEMRKLYWSLEMLFCVEQIMNHLKKCMDCVGLMHWMKCYGMKLTLTECYGMLWNVIACRADWNDMECWQWNCNMSQSRWTLSNKYLHAKQSQSRSGQRGTNVRDSHDANKHKIA